MKDNILLHNKSVPIMIGNLFCTPLIVKNRLKKSKSNILLTISVVLFLIRKTGFDRILQG